MLQKWLSHLVSYFKLYIQYHTFVCFYCNDNSHCIQEYSSAGLRSDFAYTHQSFQHAEQQFLLSGLSVHLQCMCQAEQLLWLQAVRAISSIQLSQQRHTVTGLLIHLTVITRQLRERNTDIWTLTQEQLKWNTMIMYTTILHANYFDKITQWSTNSQS